jgi:hypothetical protein
LIGLYHVAVFDFAGEVGSKEHQERQHHRQVAVSGREEGEIPLPADEQTEIFRHAAETTADVANATLMPVTERESNNTQARSIQTFRQAVRCRRNAEKTSIGTARAEAIISQPPE